MFFDKRSDDFFVYSGFINEMVASYILCHNGTINPHYFFTLMALPPGLQRNQRAKPVNVRFTTPTPGETAHRVRYAG
ncbi:hypothetical protein DBV23_03415 [Edwardsiella ictaluri]|nr:hypothetical protein DBV23_03415 [Edwardsiella ictaluri]KMQ79648.1 hypothetical protein ABY58_00700 [Edwardsiella ictaluri]KOO56355.1 hypothetical protein ACS33_00695 [Edwardsiella ictaluri]BEI01649.1 hypothetical protein KB20921_09100 [Edwardsiella ictaluri]BEI05118.1 hypothetical protein KH201010_09040 [Edwardsiella ictaluri]